MKKSPPPPPPPPPTPPLPPSSSTRRPSLPAPNTPPRTSIYRSYESHPVQTPPRAPMIPPITSTITTGSNNETITTATTTVTHNPQYEEPNIPNPNPTPNFSNPSPPPPTTITTHTTSRFKFHSDTKAPIQLSQLEQQTAQNITSFRLKLNAIDKQIAKWNTTFVNEVVDRDKDLVGMLDYVCVDPLERCSERFFERLESKMGTLWGSSSENGNGNGNGIGHGIIDNDDQSNVNNDKVADEETEGDDHMNNFNINDDQQEEIIVEDVEEGDENDGIVEETNEPIHHNQANNNIQEESTTSNRNSKSAKSSSPSIQLLSSQISSLSSNLNNYIHETVPTQIHSFQKQYTNQTPSNIQLESLKATKREQSILSKFESMAGLTKKAYVQEKATTHAELSLLRDEVNVAGGYDEYRTSRFLSEIEDVRKLLEMEKEQRRMKDELVLEKIVATREILQKMLLDALVKYDE